MPGFLGTGATLKADLNLLIQLLMGMALLIGFAFARGKRYRAHQICQTLVILLNLPMIILVMSPSFHRQVQSFLPQRLSEAYYLSATCHAILGTAAEVLGIYIVLVAGTKWLPQPLRFTSYKVWMRTEMGLWWLVILLGVGTYYYWYVVPDSTGAAQPSAIETTPTTPSRKTIIVKITNFQFDPKELTIEPGTTVEWVDESGRHTVESDDGLFQSVMLEKGGRFTFRFDQAGIYPYFCTYHGDKGGSEMAGVIRVLPQ